MQPVLKHEDLSPLFTQTIKAKENDYTPFNLFKAAFSHSSISKYAIAGTMLGWYSGQSFEMGLIGAAAGTIKDVIPILYHQLPDDLKELADQTANVGLTTLGTYAIYNSIPDMWVANIFQSVPHCIKHFPTAYKDFMDTPSPSPRSLEAAAKACMFFFSPLVVGGASAAKGALTALGFGQIRKFSVSAAGSYLGLESLKALGELPVVRPFADIVKNFAKDRGKFVSRVVDVAAAISAIPLSAYLTSNPIQPLDVTKPDAALPLYERATATALYLGGLIGNALISPQSYARVALVAGFALLHIEFNIKRPPEPKKELPEFEKITQEDLYDLLLIGLQGNQVRNAQSPEHPNIVVKLQNAIRPIRQKLDRAVHEHHAGLQTQYRNEILGVIDQKLQRLLAPPRNLGNKTQLMMNMYLIEILDIKLEELNYKMNGPGHRGGSDEAVANRAATTAQIRDSLQLKFDVLTDQLRNLQGQYVLAHNRNDNRALANKIADLMDRVDQHRTDTHNAIAAL